MRLSVFLYTIYLLSVLGAIVTIIAIKNPSIVKSNPEWSESSEGVEMCGGSSKNLRSKPSGSQTNLLKENVSEWVSSTVCLNELENYTSGFYECITLSWRIVNRRIKNTSELVDDPAKQSNHSLVVLFHFDESPTEMESFLLEPVEYRKQHPELLCYRTAVLDNKFYSLTPASPDLNESLSTMINFSGSANNTCLLIHESAGIDAPLLPSKRNSAAVISLVALLWTCSVILVGGIILGIFNIVCCVLENREHYRTTERSSMTETQV